MDNMLSQMPEALHRQKDVKDYQLLQITSEPIGYGAKYEQVAYLLVDDLVHPYVLKVPVVSALPIEPECK